MSQSRIVPLLLAGGTGTRLWPVSRDSTPKQFLPLIGKRSTSVRIVHENESVYVPIGTVHRLENPGRIPASTTKIVWFNQKLLARGQHSS